MNSAQVVIFDCDGTLISTQGQILRAAQQLVSEEWGRPVELREIQALYTPDMREFAQRANLRNAAGEVALALARAASDHCS